MSNLVLRTLSAAVLLPLAIACFVAGGWWLKGLVLFAAAACFFEYGSVVIKSDKLLRTLLFMLGVAGCFAGMVVNDPIIMLLAIDGAFMVLACVTVLRPGQDLQVTFRNLALLVFALVWVGFGVIAVVRLRDLGDVRQLDGAAKGAFILVAFTATWANDTCAYFAGRFLGKHKMAGAISPKKTWEGFIGGAIGTPIFLLIGRALYAPAWEPVSTLDMFLVSIPAALLGPVGDLTESLWKRGFDVKDSGNLIPGHGGMLDRIDAVFFVAPWTLAYFTAIKPLVDAWVA